MDVRATCRSVLAWWREILYRNRKRFLGWESIAAFSNSWIARTSFLWITIVPLAAALFSRVEKTVAVNAFGHSWSLHLVLPFSWRVFFFASLFAAAATWLCSLRCPSLIRDCRDFNAFRGAGMGPEQIENALILPKAIGVGPLDWIHFGACLSNLNTIAVTSGMNQSMADRFENFNPFLQKLHDGETITEDAFDDMMCEALTFLKLMPNDTTGLNRAFWAARQTVNHSLQAERLAATILIAAATSLYGWVLFQNAWSVIAVVTK